MGKCLVRKNPIPTIPISRGVHETAWAPGREINKSCSYVFVDTTTTGKPWIRLMKAGLAHTTISPCLSLPSQLFPVSIIRSLNDQWANYSGPWLLRPVDAPQHVYSQVRENHLSC